MPRFTAFYFFTDLIKSFEYLPNQIAYFNPLKIEIQSRILECISIYFT